ncbi:phage polarity suppression protein [Salmonella enterica]|nr:phage polarity suppression protein [Salmonella enterica]EJR2955501.1 phage polarity suppression protein [Salmonella enterica]
MTTTTLEQAFEACQTSKTNWHNHKAELTEAEAALAAALAVSSPGNAAKIATLRERIDVKSWEVNQSAGRYIRSHEEVQRISIRDRLNDFMQQHGAELAAVLAPELMGIKKQPAMIQNRAVDRSMTYLRDALSVWLETGAEIHYAEQDSEILTAIGYRPEAPSRDDSREKFTPAQNMIYVRRRAELAAQ